MAFLRKVVAIDGIDGSGKSSFSRNLYAACEQHELTPTIFRVDDFRCPVDWEQETKAEADIYYDDYYDLPALDTALSAFLAGAASVQVPRWDSALERVDGNSEVDLTATNIAIVEGVFPLRLHNVQQGTLIYLDVPYHECATRITGRDVAKGRSRVDVERRMHQRYFPSQRRYHEAYAPPAHAHVVVDNSNFKRPHLVHMKRSALGPEVAAAVQTAVALAASK